MIPTYDPKDAAYFDSHCASCGKKNRRIRFIYCGECWHPYVLGRLGLILHDMKVRIEINWRKPKYETYKDPDSHVIFWDDMVQRKDKWKYRFKALLPYRFKHIWCCPCCVHDL